MDRDQFIRVLRGCIESATGRDYPGIDWTRLSNRGLIESAELIRDLLERRSPDRKEPRAFPGELMH
jgi:hypothetical protein